MISTGRTGTVAVVNHLHCSPERRQYGIPRSAKGLRPLLLAATLWLLVSLPPSKAAAASASEVQVCDSAADHFLSIENYPETIRLHHELLKTQPDNPLAYYHVGFSYGMLGDQTNEIRAYRRAIGLGLVRWDLFLNLGLADLETHDLEGATRSLRLATLVGFAHPESHFNLASAYERRGMLEPAKRETLVSLWLDPKQLDARNILAVIYAEQEDRASAAAEWRDLLRDSPGYLPAIINLTLLNATHALDAPAHESYAVELAPARDAPALHSAISRIRNR